MLYFSFVAFFAISLVTLGFANPLERQLSLQTDGPIHSTESWDYVNCGLLTDTVQIESITVSPDPPQPGKDLTVKVQAVVSETIEEGAYADVVVKLGLVKLLHKRFDICEEARNANATIQCPVQSGPYTVEQTVALPREIPRAKFTVSVRAFTAEDDDMACVDLKVDFMKRPFFKLEW